MSQHQLFSPTSPYKVTTPMQEYNDENFLLTPFRNRSQYNSGISGAPNPTAANLLTEVATLKRKMDEEGEKSEARHKELMAQNLIFYQQAMKQDLLIKRIAAQCFPDSVDFKIIPFGSIEEIKNVEANLENYPKGEMD
ncbi:uncharacterized protein LOC118743576 [Rhagoletis pomonella]|uniref:uncharacterized protein LOC118743576 n=1 Tax=Rhagoletis pomonella TaxID=28610 RepID=UPI00177CFE7A|nr:uncharacterized protein LOC118743576 [Rhagoletis pomonella]